MTDSATHLSHRRHSAARTLGILAAGLLATCMPSDQTTAPGAAEIATTRTASTDVALFGVG